MCWQTRWEHISHFLLSFCIQSDFFPSISEPKPPRPCRVNRATGMDGWTGFNLDRQSWITQTVTKIYLHSASLTASSIWFFFSEAGTACIILACANANGLQKLERIYADLRGYRWVEIWLVIVLDFGFWCKVSCKRINLILKVHAHTLFSTPEDVLLMWKLHACL